MRKLPVVLIALALGAAACTVTGGSATTTSPPTTTTTTQAPALAPCLAGEIAYASEGTVALFGEAAGDAALIGGVRWADYDGCERLVIDLLTSDGSPGAVVGEGAAVFITPHIVRIELPGSIIDTAIGQFSTSGVAATGFVVHREDGAFFVDVILDGPASVRVFDLDAPARVVLDLVPGLGELPDPAPLIGENVVVATWTAGFPKALTGYATTREVVVGSGEDFSSVAVAAFPGSWGTFRATVGGAGDGTVAVATPGGETIEIPGE